VGRSTKYIGVPDKRKHRGRHPKDDEAFGPAAVPELKRAMAHLCWLLDRGYPPNSTLKLVGDRFHLIERQRLALMRSACTAAAARARQQRALAAAALAGMRLAIDGYNVLLTVESSLAGAIILQGRDGCWRDLAAMNGTFHKVDETLPALDVVGDWLMRHDVAEAVWFLDSPISNSGRLKSLMTTVAEAKGWPWTVVLEPAVDRTLAATADVVATADSAILDRCQRWFPLARAAVEATATEPFILDLEHVEAG
jgi:hypothetical protein